MATTTAKLTKAQKRVLVAKDVLKWLKAGAIEARGCYFQPAKAPPQEGDLKRALPKMKTCSVCGIGAAFYALVRRFDNVRIESLGDDFANGGLIYLPYKMRNILKTTFTSDQIALIEIAYEQRTSTIDRGVPNGGDRALCFAPENAGRDDRMVAIFQNIISNNGTFRP